ncbi:MAG: DUF1587 domain-containing protein, partial [Planctomycetales bacterium]|nr:DUF1587 domain-containing protein [Planctomycetales bacterium]
MLTNVKGRRRWPLVSVCLLIPLSHLIVAPARGDEDRFATQVQALLQNYCYDCHGESTQEGMLNLQQFQSTADANARPELMWSVLKNLRAHVMPPADAAQPTAEEIEQIASWIKFDVFRLTPEHLDPGRLTVRRLNRREYGNTIHDLMGIRFETDLIFPPDDSGHGFDNVGDALSFSPLLLEKYLQAARLVVAQAVPTVTYITPQQEVSGREFVDNTGATRGHHLDGKRAATVIKRVNVSEQGLYHIDVHVKLHGSFEFDPARYVVT